jgi:hypothetical protein
LITARRLVSTVRAGADDVPIRQKAAVLRRPYLLHLLLLDQAGCVKSPIEVLRQGVVLR